ncbi:hypothetical protein LH464_16035 [Neorhizobium sp. T786]|uniref:hypothetical protein n=1 Tax=Pseudorhizobium xiangyangii TaxID=2883104 RepID=UPI001CFFF969|nr:hypothetical protein [Neorhizobium xiangyangii]MCB5203979.1 hypothetical protein [Neorhizobium xiangyangii]
MIAWAVAIGVIILIFFFNRKAGYAVLALACVVGAVLSVVTKRETERHSTEHEAISVKASVDSQACTDPARPIRIEFSNGSGRTVERLSFSLIAREEENPSIVYRAFLRSDHIIGPNEASVACYELLPHGFSASRRGDHQLDNLQWSVGISMIGFAQK